MQQLPEGPGRVKLGGGGGQPLLLHLLQEGEPGRHPPSLLFKPTTQARCRSVGPGDTAAIKGAGQADTCPRCSGAVFQAEKVSEVVEACRYPAFRCSPGATAITVAASAASTAGRPWAPGPSPRALTTWTSGIIMERSRLNRQRVDEEHHGLSGRNHGINNADQQQHLHQLEWHTGFMRT